jgi:hypothetical protein
MYVHGGLVPCTVESKAFREELGFYLPLDQELPGDQDAGQSAEEQQLLQDAGELLAPVCFLNTENANQQCHFAYPSRIGFLDQSVLAAEPSAQGRRGRKQRKQHASRQGGHLPQLVVALLTSTLCSLVVATRCFLSNSPSVSLSRVYLPVCLAVYLSPSLSMWFPNFWYCSLVVPALLRACSYSCSLLNFLELS